jgi:N-acetylglucosamine kinase-like BadF-type ATPase
MILIIESGSTKSDWHIHKSREEIIKLHSEGMNPYYHTTESIEKIILNTIKIEHISEISQIYYYGAGCSNEDKKELILSAFKNIFKEAKIEVQSDIMAWAIKKELLPFWVLALIPAYTMEKTLQKG